MQLTVGDKIILNIRKQGINGEGIGYYNRTLIFVPGAIQKERVACEITFVSRNYGIAKMLKIERKSTKRVTPPCKYYEECGGCHMQHIDYSEQLKIKRDILKQALKKYTNLDVENLKITRTMGMENPYYYRNKAQMPFKNTNFGLALGFYKPESNHFVYIDECIVHHKMINQINNVVLRLLRKHDVKANDSRHRDGVLVYLVTRYLEETKQASVIFVVKSMDKRLEIIAKELMSEVKEVKSVHYSISNPKSHLVISNDIHLIKGEPYIEEKFQGLTIKLSPDAFHQMNSEQMKKMYEKIFTMLKFSAESTVFDLYSGIGITSLLMTKKVKRVYGIDYSESSMSDAKLNAKTNAIDNVEFKIGHVESVVPKLVEEGISPNIILLDPPRKGVEDKVLQAMLKSSANQILYISCNPSTLAKDLSQLLKQYQVELIVPVDMFPNTASVESMTLLTRK